MNILIGFVLLLSSAALAAVIGRLFSAGSNRDSDDAAQAEYLSHWSDMKRLRKQG